MRIVTAALVAIAVSPAAADTAVRIDAACEVRFVRAPDDVRHVIESWLAAEPRCTSSIELRVIPTEHGYYLMAQRPDGRIHERLVPDAQSAGVLVASWVADDWVAPRSEGPSAPRPTAAVLAPPAYMTPGEVPAATAISMPGLRHTSGPRWLSAGAMFSTSDTDDGGLRVELDLISRGSWTLGVALAWTETSMAISSSPYGNGQMRSDDTAATIYGAYTVRSDRWELRGALGLGGVYSEVHGDLEVSPTEPWTQMSYFDGTGPGAIGTASLLVTRRLGEGWGIHAGVLAHVLTERFPTKEGVELERNDHHMFLFTGLRRRL